MVLNWRSSRGGIVLDFLGGFSFSMVHKTKTKKIYIFFEIRTSKL
jgi:hypothetical protein